MARLLAASMRPMVVTAMISGVMVAGWVGIDKVFEVAGKELIRFETPMLPAGQYRFDLSGEGGDADLYVRMSQPPTTSTYDCRPYKIGSNEGCTVSLVNPRVIHIMVRGYAPSSKVRLVGREQSGR